MAHIGRHPTAIDGQLDDELRRRGLSGVQFAAFAAFLEDIGEPVWACERTAAALHGLSGFVLRPPFHVVVPRGRDLRRIGHVIHTSTDLPRIDREHVFGLPVMSPARTLIDLASAKRPDQLATALESAVEQGLVTDDFLHRRIADLRSSGRYGVPRLIEVLERYEIGRGTESWLERRFLEIVLAAGLPRPQTQQVLGRRGDRIIRVDFRFPGTPIVVETLGYRWHRSGAQMRIDAERMNRLLIEGFLPLQFTYAQVVKDEERVLDVVTAALRPYLTTAA
jgi:very-short-patch-repair endonuclease